MRPSRFACLLWLLPWFASASEPPPAIPDAAKIDAEVARLMSQVGAKGMAVAVIDDG